MSGSHSLPLILGGVHGLRTDPVGARIARRRRTYTDDPGQRRLGDSL